MAWSGLSVRRRGCARRSDQRVAAHAAPSGPLRGREPFVAVGRIIAAASCSAHGAASQNGSVSLRSRHSEETKKQCNDSSGNPRAIVAPRLRERGSRSALSEYGYRVIAGLKRHGAAAELLDSLEKEQEEGLSACLRSLPERWASALQRPFGPLPSFIDDMAQLIEIRNRLIHPDGRVNGWHAFSVVAAHGAGVAVLLAAQRVPASGVTPFRHLFHRSRAGDGPILRRYGPPRH